MTGNSVRKVFFNDLKWVPKKGRICFFSLVSDFYPIDILIIQLRKDGCRIGKWLY